MKHPRDKSTNQASENPSPATTFEADVVQEMKQLVSSLPPKTAALSVRRVPGHSDWPEPYFEVTPSNPRAARFAGAVVSTDLHLTIGEAEREFVGFARGGNIIPGSNWQDDLRWIWQAVIAGGFTQKHYLGSNGNVIGWAAKLIVNSTELVLSNGRRAERLFGREKVKTVTYEPYIESEG